MKRRVFVTGGTGFIGRQLVAGLLSDDGIQDVSCLLRNPSTAALLPDTHRLKFTTGDITRPDSWVQHLSHCDTVIHLAAATGNVSKNEHWRVNCEGTKRLIDASVQAGVRRVVFVSSIAAGYPDQKHYHYAQSKAAAEKYVLDSPLQTTVIRPTVVTGHDAPVTRGLSRLRRGPLLILFGAGQVRVQPIAVQDLVKRLCTAATEPPHEPIVEVGGRDVLTLRRFMELLSSPSAKPPAPVHIPARPARLLLAVLEPLIGRWLPLTAGQLALFLNDSTASPTASPETQDMMELEELVDECRT